MTQETQQEDHSTPTYWQFNPQYIPMQAEVIDLVNNKYDYSKGVLEILLSGSVGSSKSLLAAHIIVNHCMKYRGARVAICRRALPDIKRTIYQKIKEHMGGREIPGLFEWQDTTATIQFPAHNSEIVACSWADKRYKKFRSLELSGIVVEEAVESIGDDVEAITELRMRVGRLMHVPQSWILFLTNPDGPSHWIYDDFCLGDDE